MRIAFPLSVALALIGLLTPPAAAQPVALKPAVEVRVRSVNDLLVKAEYLGGVVNQAEPAKQLVGLVWSLTDEKSGIDGVDPTRPFGLYAFVSPNVTDGPLALMIPLADETAFLTLLRAKAHLDPKKRDDGAYEVAVPGVPTPVYFRFAHRTVYVTVQSAKNIDPAALVPPNDFFAGDDGAVASARLHFDRIPADVKKVILGQFELKVADAKARTDPGETPAQQKLRAWAVERLMEAVAAVLTDGEQLAVRVSVEPKTDDLGVEVTFSSREGSATAKWVRDVGGQTGRTAALQRAVDGVAVAAGVRFTLPDPARAEWGPVVDGLLRELVEKAAGNQRPVAKLVADAVAPTLKAGVLDAQVVAGVPEPGGPVTVLAGLRLVEGGRVDQLVKFGAALVPEKEARLTYDAKKSGGLTIHKAVVSNPALKAATGTDTVWFAVGEDVVLVSVEPDGKAIGAAAAATAGLAPVADVSVAVGRALPSAEKGLKPDTLTRLTGEVFGPAGPGKGQDGVSLSVQGGDRLYLKLAVKGKAVKLGVLVDQEKKKGD